MSISKEQIEKNKDCIKEKLAKEKADKETIAKEKTDAILLKEKEETKKKEKLEDRENLAVRIAEEIKGCIASELEDVVKGIEKLKISSPEIPEIKIDTDKIVEAIKKLEISSPKITIPETKIDVDKIVKGIKNIKITPIIPEIEIPEIVLPETPKIDTDKIVEAVIDGIQETFKAPLKVISIDENGDINKGRIIPGGGAYKWLKNTAGENINPATEDKQDDLIALKTVPTDIEGVGNISVGTTEVEVAITGTTKSIRIRADVDNTGEIFIGKTGVLSDGTNDFVRLEAGDEAVIDYNDTDNALYAISDTASQKINVGAII